MESQLRVMTRFWDCFGRTSTDTLSVVALSQETVDTTDGECETGLGRAPVIEEGQQIRSRLDHVIWKWLGYWTLEEGEMDCMR